MVISKSRVNLVHVEHEYEMTISSSLLILQLSKQGEKYMSENSNVIKKIEKVMNKNTILQLVPGVFICLVITLIGIYVADLIGIVLVKSNVLPAASASPVSGIFVAILLGILIRNLVGLYDLFKKGIAFSLKFILRAGIILLGLRLSLLEAIKLGAWGLPLIIICISSGLFITLYFTKKLNQSKRLGTLIAGGTESVV